MKIECKWSHLAQRAEERGYYLPEVMACICERKKDNVIVVDTDHPAYPKKVRVGPGTVMTVLLRKLGFKHETGCRCKDRAKQMNAWGPDECERRVDEISGWLAEGAKNKGIPYLPALGKRLISVSIGISRRRLRNGTHTSR